MADNLFTPTITAAPRSGAQPWRVSSLVYPAFFGGPLAVTVLGLVNGARLGLGRRAQLAVAGAGLGALLARVAVGIATGGSWLGVRSLVGSAAGVAAWLALAAVQRRPFRAYELRGGEPAKLFLPGLGAVFTVGLIEAIVVYLAVQAAVGT